MKCHEDRTYRKDEGLVAERYDHMGPVRLGVGTEWLLDGRAWRVVRQLAPDRFVAQDIKFHTEQAFSQEEILAHYATGQLRFASDNASAVKALGYLRRRRFPSLANPRWDGPLHVALASSTHGRWTVNAGAEKSPIVAMRPPRPSIWRPGSCSASRLTIVH